MDHRAFQQAATHQIQQWLGVFAALDDPAGHGFAGGCRCHVGSAPSRSGAAAGHLQASHGGFGASAHVHRLGGEPDGVDANHCNSSRRKTRVDGGAGH